jgi:hypothetical protein
VTFGLGNQRSIQLSYAGDVGNGIPCPACDQVAGTAARFATNAAVGGIAGNK